MNMRKYDVGDIVRVVSKRSHTMNSCGMMDHYLGTTVTISKLVHGLHGDAYHIREDDRDFGKWYFYDHDFECLASICKETENKAFDSLF